MTSAVQRQNVTAADCNLIRSELQKQRDKICIKYSIKPPYSFKHVFEITYYKCIFHEVVVTFFKGYITTVHTFLLVQEPYASYCDTWYM